MCSQFEQQTLVKAEPSDSGPSPTNSAIDANMSDFMTYSLSTTEQLWDVDVKVDILPTEVMTTEKKAEDVIDLTDDAVEVFTNVRFSHKKKKKKKKKKKTDRRESLWENSSALKTFCSTNSADILGPSEEVCAETVGEVCLKVEVDNFVVVQNPDYDEGESEMETKDDIDATAVAVPEVTTKASSRKKATVNYNEDILKVTWPDSRQVSTRVGVDPRLTRDSVSATHSMQGSPCFKCSQCERTFLSDLGLKRHVQMKHSARALEMKWKYGCEYCDESFSTQAAKVRHKKRHVGPVYKGVNAGNLSLRTVACTLCEKKYASEEHWKNHQKIHSDGLRFGCDDCGKAFSVLSRLNDHLCQSHGLVRLCPFPCPVPECGKAFTSRDNLHNHVKLHTKKVTHDCPDCGKSFSERGNMRRHRKLHLGIKEHRCTHCGKEFSEKASLQGHVRMVHTGERPYPCLVCRNAFATRSDLTRHQLKHSSVCKYKCLDCGKSFKRRGSLIRHQRVENGQNRWQCGECGKRFASKGNLKVHMHVHSGIRRFECGVCKKKFSVKTSLETHLRVHTGDKPYTCSRCDKRFSCSSNRSRHEKTVHEVQERVWNLSA